MVDPSTVPQEHAVEVFSEVLRRILTEPQQQQLCLFLDVDGTLSEVAPTPAQAIIVGPFPIHTHVHTHSKQQQHQPCMHMRTPVPSLPCGVYTQLPPFPPPLCLCA